MLIRELILHHVGDGTVHQRGYVLPLTQTRGIRLHPAGAPARLKAGDLLMISASAHDKLSDVVDADLPPNTTVVLLLATEPAALPVGRLASVLIASGLKVLEAVVASGMPQPTVAVVARRSDDVLLPVPYTARSLDPGQSPDDVNLRPLSRILAETVLERLSQRARERELLGELGEAQDGRRAADSANQKLEHLPEELAIVKAERNALRAERNALRAERNALRKRLDQVESSNSYRLASRLARTSGAVRRLISGSSQ